MNPIWIPPYTTIDEYPYVIHEGTCGVIRGGTRRPGRPAIKKSKKGAPFSRAKYDESEWNK